MGRIEDKLTIFSKTLYEKLKEERDKEIQKTRQEMQESLILKQKELKDKLEKAIIEVKKNSEKKAKEIVARENLKMNREVLYARKAMMDALIVDVEDKLKAFVDSEKYERYILKELNKTFSKLNYRSCKLFLTEKDAKRYKEKITQLLKDRNIEIKTVENDIIGGFILEDLDGKIRLDNSLKAILDSKKDYIGLKISDLVD